MKLPRLLRHLRRNGDLAEAREQRQHSEAALEKTQREVTGPLHDLADRNHYAEIIARQIREGRGNT
jgi:transcription elongation GreA/GreB family factor